MVELTKEDIAFADGCAFRICNKWGAFCNEDIKASAREGLAKAAIRHENELGQLKTLAYVIIKASIANYFREMLGKRRQVDYFKAIEFLPFHINENNIHLSVDGIEEKVIFKDLLYKFTKLLDYEEYTYLQYCLSIDSNFLKPLQDGRTDAISQILGCTKARVWYVNMKLKSKLKKFLADNEI